MHFETTVININKKLNDKKENLSLELETNKNWNFGTKKITIIGNKNLMEVFVTANFMFQLDWITLCPDIWLHIIFECVCEDVLGWG